MSRTTIRIAVAAVALLAVASLTAPASAAPSGQDEAAGADGCAIDWGSQVKKRAVNRHTTAPVKDVRSGRHQCFDRLVIDLGAQPKSPSGQKLGYRVRYVKSVIQPGSGEKLSLAGGAAIQITVNAPAYNAKGKPTYVPADPMNAVNVTGYSTFRQVAFAGSFEGQTVLGIGVRARLPMRVMILSGPGNGRRLVIDVAHKW